MKNLQLFATSFLLIVLTLHRSGFLEAYQIIHVDKTLLECLEELRTGTNDDLERYQGLQLITMMKSCPTHNKYVENLLMNEKQSDVGIAFTDDKVTLVLKHELVDFVEKREVQYETKSGSRFLDVGSLFKSVIPAKTPEMQSTSQPTKPNDVSQLDGQEEMGSHSQTKNPPDVESGIANVPKIVLDAVSHSIDGVWSALRTVLSEIINDCYSYPKIEFNTSLLSMKMKEFQICGLGNSRLGSLTKTKTSNYWNVSLSTDFHNLTLTFDGLHTRSQILPYPFSNLNLEGMQFHFDGLSLRSLMKIPFRLPMIPTSFRTKIEVIDNVDVKFLTPEPTLQQRVMAYSIQAGIQLFLERMFDTILSVLDLPVLLNQLTGMI